MYKGYFRIFFSAWIVINLFCRNVKVVKKNGFFKQTAAQRKLYINIKIESSFTVLKS